MPHNCSQGQHHHQCGIEGRHSQCLCVLCGAVYRNKDHKLAVMKDWLLFAAAQICFGIAVAGLFWAITDSGWVALCAAVAFWMGMLASSWI